MQSFAECVQVEPIQLDCAALLVAREIEYNALNIEHWLMELDRFASEIAPQIRLQDTRQDKLRRINRYLFDDRGFAGNSENYYDPRNSFINDVLIRRTGIPITLSVLYIAVARRLDLPVYGVGLPGHFIVGCPTDDGDTLYVDPYHEGLFLSEAECLTLASTYAQDDQFITSAILAPQTNDLILMRILNNLRHIYLSKSEPARLLRVLHLQQALAPHSQAVQRDIGVLYFHLEAWREAAHTLRQYLHNYPHDEDYETIRAVLDKALANLTRWN